MIYFIPQKIRISQIYIIILYMQLRSWTSNERNRKKKNSEHRYYTWAYFQHQNTNIILLFGKGFATFGIDITD